MIFERAKRGLEQLGLVPKQETPEQRERRAVAVFEQHLKKGEIDYIERQFALEDKTLGDFPYNDPTLKFGDYSAGFLVQFEKGFEVFKNNLDRFTDIGDYTAWSILNSHELRDDVETAMEFIGQNKELFRGRLGKDTMSFLFELPGDIDSQDDEEIEDYDEEDADGLVLRYGNIGLSQTNELADAPILGEDEDDSYEVGAWDMIETLFNEGCFDYQQLDNQECRDMLGKIGLSLEPQEHETVN